MDSSSHLVRVIGPSTEGRWINLCSHPTVICRYCISNLLLKPHFVTCVKPQPFSWIGVGVQIAGHQCQCWWPGAVSWHSRNAGHRHGSARGGGMGTLDTLDTLDITIDIYLGRYLDKGQLVEQTRTALHISGDLWQSASVAVMRLLRHVSDVSQCSAWRVQDSQNDPSFIVSEIHVAH